MKITYLPKRPPAHTQQKLTRVTPWLVLSPNHRCEGVAVLWRRVNVGASGQTTFCSCSIEVAFYTVSTVKKSDLHTGRKVLSLHTLFMIPGIFACV